MSKQTQNFSYKQAADIARKQGYLFTRPCYEGKALFFRPAHTATAGDIQKYASVPDVVKGVLQNVPADTSVGFSDYLCVLDISVNGNITIGQGFQASEKDRSASDWMLITDAAVCDFINPAHD
jgi:hypothetical protein